MQRSLPNWNLGKGIKEFGDRPDFLLVADDAAGGFFALNYGAMGKEHQNMIFYLTQDNLKWESLDMYYEDFLFFCIHDELKKFYKGVRWKDWKKDISTLSADQVFHSSPPAWSKDGRNIEKAHRKPVPVAEQFSFNLDIRAKLGLE